MDWDLYPNFKREEFECHEHGECIMHPQFMNLLQEIRENYGKPMIISSGYRCRNHSLEIIKDKPGEHTYGLAADILVHGRDAIELLYQALDHGVCRIGISQLGDISKRFIHLGLGDEYTNIFKPAIWTY